MMDKCAARIQEEKAAALEEKRRLEETTKVVRAARAKLTEDEWVAICDYLTSDYEGKD